MSGGEQQMLAIGRALMADPALLLLDEPSLGLAPMLVDRIYETVAEINKQGTTILLVEQSANHALEVSNRGYVLETGKVVLTDDSSALATTPKSRRRTSAYDDRLRTHRRDRAVAHLRLAASRRSSPPTCPTARATASAPASPPACCSTSSASSSGWSSRPRRTRCGSGSARGAAGEGHAAAHGRRRRRAARRGRLLDGPPAAPHAAAGSQSAAAAGSRQGAGTGTEASDCPPSPARGVTLHHTRSPDSYSITSQ